MQKHNPYIHPIRNKLTEMFDIKATLANLSKRKNIKGLIKQQDIIIDKWETLYNNAKNGEEFFFEDRLKESKELKEKLEKTIQHLRIEYKRLKATANDTTQQPTFIEYDKEAIRRIPITNILKQFGHEPKQLMQGREKYLCIYHNEKTPSLVVNLNENYAHCFGCDKSADVIEIYQKLAGVDFITSLKELNDYI